MQKSTPRKCHAVSSRNPSTQDSAEEWPSEAGLRIDQRDKVAPRHQRPLKIPRALGGASWNRSSGSLVCAPPAVRAASHNSTMTGETGPRRSAVSNMEWNTDGEPSTCGVIRATAGISDAVAAKRFGAPTGTAAEAGTTAETAVALAFATW